MNKDLRTEPDNPVWHVLRAAYKNNVKTIDHETRRIQSLQGAVAESQQQVINASVGQDWLTSHARQQGWDITRD